MYIGMVRVETQEEISFQLHLAIILYHPIGRLTRHNSNKERNERHKQDTPSEEKQLISSSEHI